MFVLVMAVRARWPAHVGAAFRIERRLDRDDLRAEASRHVLDHRITANSAGFSATARSGDGGCRNARRSGSGRPRRGRGFRPAARAPRPLRRRARRRAADRRPRAAATASGRSSRKPRPRTPVIATRRRWRSSKSRTTESTGSPDQAPAGTTVSARSIAFPSGSPFPRKGGAGMSLRGSHAGEKPVRSSAGGVRPALTGARPPQAAFQSC